MINKEVIGNILLIIHILLFLICLWVLFFSKNIIYNFIVYFYIMLVCIGWIIFNCCIFTPLENYLYGDKEKYSIFSVILSKVFGVKYDRMDVFLIYTNYVIFLILSIKIYFINMYSNKK